MRLRIGTFNVENLFSRFRFAARLTHDEIQAAMAQGWQAEQTLYEPFDTSHRRYTAAVIQAIDADILGLQEVESLETLKRFNGQFLDGMGYRYAMCIDGNDARGIDVALLSRYPLACLRTHQFDHRDGHPEERIFSRDCLEADIRLPDGREVSVLVNHFKSIAADRPATMEKRQRQARRVAQILEERFGPDPGEALWFVLGDLNDYPPSSGLAPLLGRPWLENVVARLPEPERWTHHYARDDEYHQLDYVLASRRIAEANPRILPYVERRGLPRRAERAGRRRFKGIGDDRPKASDHCPVVWECVLPE